MPQQPNLVSLEDYLTEHHDKVDKVHRDFAEAFDLYNRGVLGSPDVLERNFVAVMYAAISLCAALPDLHIVFVDAPPGMTEEEADILADEESRRPFPPRPVGLSNSFPQRLPISPETLKEITNDFDVALSDLLGAKAQYLAALWCGKSVACESNYEAMLHAIARLSKAIVQLGPSGFDISKNPSPHPSGLSKEELMEVLKDPFPPYVL